MRETGYLHHAYADSFAEWGVPRRLEAAGGWLVEREIPGSDLRDAMGCYPLFSCQDWSRLGEDLDALGDDLVSVALVTDPFGDYDESHLRATFEVVSPLKEHYVADLTLDDAPALPRRHRRNVARATQQVDVDRCGDPSAHADEWRDLHAGLVTHRAITGLRAMSRRALERQLQVPGLVMFRATAGSRVAGIHLWYLQGTVAYGHLGATNQLGYELMAAYALYAAAAEHFRGRARWLALGAAAGADHEEEGDGLRQFKRGWSTGTRTAYLCGRIVRPADYAALTRASDSTRATYFPAYRAGEMSG